MGLQDTKEIIVVPTKYVQATIRQCSAGDPDKNPMLGHAWCCDKTLELRESGTQSGHRLAMLPPVVASAAAAIMIPLGLHNASDILKGRFVQTGFREWHGVEIDDVHTAGPPGEVRGIEPRSNDIGVWPAVWVRSTEHLGGFGRLDFEWPDLNRSLKADPRVLP